MMTGASNAVTYLERSEIKLFGLLDEAAAIQELGVLEDGVAVVGVALYCPQKIVVCLLRCRTNIQHQMSRKASGRVQLEYANGWAGL